MSDLNLNEVVEDVNKKAEEIPTEELGKLADLARKQLALENEIEDLETKLKTKGDELKMLSEVTIPEVFSKLGIQEFKLSNGLKVKVTPFYSGKADTDAAFDWLEKHQHADIIKGEFTVMYRRPDKDKITAFNKLAEELGFSVKDKLAVHPMTMKSFIREQIEATTPNFPRELFNVFTGFKTKIGK